MMTPSDDFFWDRLKPPNSLYRGGELFVFFFFSGEFGDSCSDSCALIFAAFRNYNLGFHVVFARFCSSYACWVGGGRG